MTVKRDGYFMTPKNASTRNTLRPAWWYASPGSIQIYASVGNDVGVARISRSALLAYIERTRPKAKRSAK